MMRICLALLLGVLMTLILINNVLFDKELILQKQLFVGSVKFPGNEFLVLKKYLTGVRMAGYWTDKTPLNPDIDTSFMFTFQRAQFALAPTFLDHYRPLEHEFVILYSKDKKSLNDFLTRHKSKIIAQFSNKILIKQTL